MHVISLVFVLSKQADNHSNSLFNTFPASSKDVLQFDYSHFQTIEPERTTDLRCDCMRDPAELDGLLAAAPLHVAPPVHQLVCEAVIEAGGESGEGLPGVGVLDRQGEHLCAGVAVTWLVIHVALGGAAEELVHADQE